MECGECERDLRGGHDPACSRYVAHAVGCPQASDEEAACECDAGIACMYPNAEANLGRDHSEHGRSSDGDGPDDPDCPCRETEKEAECASRGCGFCRAAQDRLKAQTLSAAFRSFDQARSRALVARIREELRTNLKLAADQPVDYAHPDGGHTAFVMQVFDRLDVVREVMGE